MQIKRRATSPVRPSPAKRHAREEPNGTNRRRIEEEVGIVNRTFYPPEMSNARCEQYNNNEIPRPLTILDQTLKNTENDRRKIAAGECVVHWFKRDLRITDNRGLSLAGSKAKEAGVPLICMFVVSPQDYEAHCTSKARVDFDLRSLQVLKEDLEGLDVPLYTATIEDRKNITSHILGKCKEWGAKHMFCNIEYEVDELRRETTLVKKCLEAGINFVAVHDDVVVPPETLVTGAGKQYSVYSPWYRSWVKHIHAHPHLLAECPAPVTNHSGARQKFTSLFGDSNPIPSTPPNKSLSSEDRSRLLSYWPAGEHEARERLNRFLETRIPKYKDTRNLPGENSTSLLSVHFSAGTLASRTAIRRAVAANKGSNGKLDAGNQGTITWISELAWRDFYKHVLAHWPYVCMSKPFKYEYADIEWEYNDEHFRRWKQGKTGFPIVDAAMRQILGMSYCHNRCRMIVASFFAKDLLLDWRQGEKYFMENLIDGDFASNNGGWGFSASTGVDPQPYFRIFNPLLQSEKFDAQGDYIRKWVPELRSIEGKAVHDPYGRGAMKEAERSGYPRPMVEHKGAREKALERYKNGLGRGTANVGGGVHN
ncbi:hypothetical protein K431DRAFT_285335 [Polychaeton citri CBS 116435]|uniref:Photolyase/cryptochrome alpha/beta domain-containing protein n=1 Tax=Polychaeton citri CBS 116435 TaxID=1314669 RepID=A0A9P4Q7W8_9PEZI|nr:hypothetical protein K431DRAFT_285335 [Polychaeton citri CBS 116435]